MISWKTSTLNLVTDKLRNSVDNLSEPCKLGCPLKDVVILNTFILDVMIPMALE
jgi:hypothetical protein